jgi:hypothetical protein
MSGMRMKSHKNQFNNNLAAAATAPASPWSTQGVKPFGSAVAVPMNSSLPTATNAVSNGVVLSFPTSSTANKSTTAAKAPTAKSNKRTKKTKK